MTSHLALFHSPTGKDGHAQQGFGRLGNVKLSYGTCVEKPVCGQCLIN
jgi:hypothetical protein